MPSPHQKRTFQALLLAYLHPHRSPLPEHNPLRSASSISRFLNHYDWPTLLLVRLSRQALREWLLSVSHRPGPRPPLRVIIDLTCCEKTGRFPGLGSWINAMNGKRGLQLVMMYLELGQARVPWDFRIWNGKGTTSPMTQALRMLASLPPELTQRHRVIVLADAWFASKGFIEGIHERGYHAIVGMRPDRQTSEGRPLTRLKRRGLRVLLKGLSIPVWVSWFYLKGKDGSREQRFVISTRPMAGSKLVREGRHRWRIESFFKTIKYTFALQRGSQGTRLGMVRFLLLSLLAFVLTFATHFRAGLSPRVAWTRVVRDAVVQLLSGTLVLALLAELERRRALLEGLGMSVVIHRRPAWTHNCKI